MVSSQLLKLILFPAQAGVIPNIGAVGRPACAVPRASGGDPKCRAVPESAKNCSPRKRG